jgi:hypothetical protein
VRAYTVTATAVTLGVTKKWIDNVLSHHSVEGVLHEKQGIQRQVTPIGLLTLEIAIGLGRSMNVPIGRALEMSNHLIAAKGGEVAFGPSLKLRADVESISRELNHRLERALEMTPAPRRGRPRYK